MDFTLLKRIENESVCYKLLKANFYRNYYVIIVQTKREFCCGSICASRAGAEELFCEIADSATDPCCLADILCDYEKQKI